jgi:hypothetical protein
LQDSFSCNDAPSDGGLAAREEGVRTASGCITEHAMAKTGKWSAQVTEHSHALDLEPHIFEKDDPKEIAASLKRSADRSGNRKSEPFRSAMSMLTFYINRAGKNLPADRRTVLEDAKDELRKAYGREAEG